MPPSLLDVFRALASFDPPRGSLADAPWEAYVDWAIINGLGPLAAYNLEYRLAGADAPEWVRDRLLSVYQGSLNDNVMKLVNFKRTVGELEGRKLVVLGAASFAEALYPHVAFRPVPDIRLLVHPGDLDGLTGFLGGSDFKSEPELTGAEGAARVLSDGRTQLLLFTRLLSAGADATPLFDRALPMRVYGPSVFRLDLEDAFLAACAEQARAGYQVPMLTFLDLRELLLGAPSMGAAYSRPLQVERLARAAQAAKLERALYVSLQVLARLFPATASAVEAALPPLRGSTRALLDRLLVRPLSELGKVRTLRGAGRLRQLLSGGF